ncbi:T9SS type A sorting domain-containing protein, partial [bacterium]|nr:T9SS type A sorting domain-containing protein [bacterium]
NMPSLKTHGAGGITVTAKNHQGSIIKLDAKISGTMNVGYAHASLPDAVSAYKSYRHLVDYLGHKDMGGKTVLNIVDGIWGGREFWGKIFKWDMEPFNGDYPSSIFLSQDAIAIESVAYDFLLEEFKDKPSDNSPAMPGVDDYMLQAADKSYWPGDIEYDPENDGSTIGSLGVYEHWNNPELKQYSRNLNTGKGVELIKSFQTGTAVIDNIFINETSVTVYPNPVTETVNIDLKNSWRGNVTLRLFNLNGQLVSTNQKMKTGNAFQSKINVTNLNAGTYIVDLEISGEYFRKKIIKK